VIEALVARLQRAGRIRAAGEPGGRQLRLRIPPQLVAAAVAALLALGGAWLWFRDSSLVAVKRVQITGVSGPDAAQIRSALTAAARNMTTLDVDRAALQAAVSPFSVVRSVSATTQFPHGMRIHVIEQIPVAAIAVGGRSISVAADGTLLHDVPADQSLPAIPLDVPPVGARLTDARALGAVAVLAAAPYVMLSHISQVSTVSPHGLVAQLRNGPDLYFGDPQDLGAKWTAAIRVLADAGSAGATYIDVSDPERPAAGSDAATATGTATSAASTTTTSAAATAAGAGPTGSGTSATAAGSASGGPSSTGSGGG
jgi:cell division protein FtsQ